MQKQNPTWLKNRGYLHITTQIDVNVDTRKLLSKIHSPSYIAHYAFFPLIHASIDERRYKVNPESSVSDYRKKKKCHSYQDTKGDYQKHIKSRPLHYATHMDALIFGYYAQLLQDNYEKELAKDDELSKCVLAYRRIKISDDVDSKHKSTIHFAKEVFEEIKKRCQDEDCMVLAFDIKSFFSSLNHKRLKNAWAKLINEDLLPKDHYNVFKATTRFSYIMLDDLRIRRSVGGRKAPFDEKNLAKIRNKHGINAFFASPEEFRHKIKNNEIKLHRFPFRKGEDTLPTGIPQGLPLSAILANLYLLEFDKLVLQKITRELGGYYRRYSDDIVVVCKKENVDEIERFVTESIKDSLVKISPEKTEKFLFTQRSFGNQSPRLTAVKLTNDTCIMEAPFIYLGFAFNGSQTLIKSTNLAKFYRRMISTVKRKSRLALKIAEEEGSKPVVFRKRLYKLYMTSNLNKTIVKRRYKKLKMNDVGEYRIESVEKEQDFRSNYLSYMNRASTIMDETAIKNQIRKHRNIFNQAFLKHLRRK